MLFQETIFIPKLYFTVNILEGKAFQNQTIIGKIFYLVRFPTTWNRQGKLTHRMALTSRRISMMLQDHDFRKMKYNKLRFFY
jgi:hypothetical protein